MRLAGLVAHLDRNGEHGVIGVVNLLGARVDVVGFGIAHFRLDLSDETRQFSVSTSADVCVSGGILADFRKSRAVTQLVDLVGACLKEIRIEQDSRTGALEFDNGIEVRVWRANEIYDNLLVIRDGRGEGWFVLG
jgi:hypothetical protein